MKYLFLLFIFCAALFASAQTLTWSAPLDVAMSMYGNQHPRVVLDGSGNPLLLWGDSDKAMFSRWNGTSFSTPVQVSPMPIQIFAQSWAGPDIAAKGDTVYVIYKQSPEEVNHIFIVRSLDGGMTFSAPVQVDNIGTNVSRFPTLTVDNMGNPIVAFMKFDAGFGNARWVVSKSNDLGNTFMPDALASDWSGGDVCDCCPAAIVSEGSNVAMLYRDNASNIRDSWAGLSTNGGTSFSNGWNIDEQNWMIMSCPSTGPDGVIVGDSLYSVFMNGANSSRVYWSASSLSTLQKTPTQPLTGNITGLATQNYPRIASAGNALAIAWKQRVSNADQLVLRFTNNIANGLPDTLNMVAMAGVTNTDVVVNNGNIFVVWEDENSGTVKYRKATFTPLTSAISATQNNDFQLIASPNPASNDWKITGNSQLNMTKMALFNSMGEQILFNTIGKQTDVSTTIDNSELPKGVYILTVTNRQGSQNIRLIKN